MKTFDVLINKDWGGEFEDDDMSSCASQAIKEYFSDLADIKLKPPKKLEIIIKRR